MLHLVAIDAVMAIVAIDAVMAIVAIDAVMAIVAIDAVMAIAAIDAVMTVMYYIALHYHTHCSIMLHVGNTAHAHSIYCIVLAIQSVMAMLAIGMGDALSEGPEGLRGHQHRGMGQWQALQTPHSARA